MHIKNSKKLEWLIALAMITVKRKHKKEKGYIFKVKTWTGEIAHWRRSFVALIENLGSIPSTYMVTHNHL